MMPGFFLAAHATEALMLGTSLSQTQSRSRPQAEYAANLAQAEFFAKDNAVEEQQFVTQAREAKTLRLRDARMAKELKARTAVLSGLISMRATKA
jgi:hypothetical protein